MSTIEKTIKKLRQQYEFTHNSTEIHSNSSFFEEERSENFQDDDLSLQEDDSPYYWQQSSIQINNSIIPLQTLENNQNFNSMPNPTQAPVRGNFAQGIIGNSLLGSNNNNSGKGIAIHVLGQESIGKSNKKGKKQEKCNKKTIKNLNNQININNNNTLEQQQQSSFLNQNSHSQSNSQQNKQICFNQKVILAFLLLETNASKEALKRAKIFIKKFMPNDKNKELLINIQETYKIMLLPDYTLKKLAYVLSYDERMLYLNLSLNRLNLVNNRHPLADQSAEKIIKHFQNC